MDVAATWGGLVAGESAKTRSGWGGCSASARPFWSDQLLLGIASVQALALGMADFRRKYAMVSLLGEEDSFEDTQLLADVATDDEAPTLPLPQPSPARRPTPEVVPEIVP